MEVFVKLVVGKKNRDGNEGKGRKDVFLKYCKICYHRQSVQKSEGKGEMLRIIIEIDLQKQAGELQQRAWLQNS